METVFWTNFLCSSGLVEAVSVVAGVQQNFKFQSAAIDLQQDLLCCQYVLKTLPLCLRTGEVHCDETDFGTVFGLQNGGRD